VDNSYCTFIGVDLAWSPRNPTGAAVLRGDAGGAELIDHALLGDNRSIVDYIARHAGDRPAIVAVDAPLCVPNEAGRRPGEAEIGRAFGRYQAGAHPANRRRLAFDGVVRGEALVAALAERGFTHAPEVAAGGIPTPGPEPAEGDGEAPARQVIEVFPHPAMVALFGLERTLKYKARPGRGADVRLAEWRRYQGYLDALAQADPPLRGQAALTAQDVAALRGRRLKDYEDQVDALMCAYIALYAFRWGAARCQVFGTFEGGYIFTPVPEAMWPRRDLEIGD
jgi:predicted RNase H-like nuclease